MRIRSWGVAVASGVVKKTRFAGWSLLPQVRPVGTAAAIDAPSPKALPFQSE